MILKKTGRGLVAMLLAGTMLGAMPAVAKDNDTLVVARAMDINSLDPSRTFCDTCQIYMSSIYQPLLTLGADNKSLVPNLAEKWDVNADFTEFTFHLKPAKFADGTPVEASDVVWTMQRLKNLKGSPSFLMDGMVSVEAVDASTVKFKMDRPNSEFLNKVSAPYTGIMNAEAAAAAGAIADETAATEDKAEAWFLSNSVGSGPYVLESYSPDHEMRFARNPNYVGTAPAFSNVVITQIADAVSQAQALETGQVDIAMQVDADTAASIQSEEVTTSVVPSFNFVYIGLLPGSPGMADALKPAVREALALAIDYDGMMDVTIGGNGKPQAAPIPNGFPGSANLVQRKQDVAKAQQLLADAGVTSLTLQAGYPSLNVYGVDFNTLMQKLQQDFAAVGVTLELKPLTWTVWWDEFAASAWPVTAVYYAPDYYGSGQYVDYFGMREGSAWLVNAGHDTPEIVRNDKEAELYAKALATSGDESAAAYAEIGQQMIDEAIILPLFSPNLVLAYRSDIEGMRYSACCNLPIAELSRK